MTTKKKKTEPDSMEVTVFGKTVTVAQKKRTFPRSPAGKKRRSFVTRAYHGDVPGVAGGYPGRQKSAKPAQLIVAPPYSPRGRVWYASLHGQYVFPQGRGKSAKAAVKDLERDALKQFKALGKLLGYGITG